MPFELQVKKGDRIRLVFILRQLSHLIGKSADTKERIFSNIVLHSAH